MQFLKNIRSDNIENINVMAQKLVDLSNLDNIEKKEFGGFILEATGKK
ncbi:hypothetical protein I6I93_02250 [Peptoniphilus harei]|nr:hypothetical protein [Peptoniphilus harei]QQT91427.1 hypothetical protein I6I93_02250 [Peptoniphilus harei]